MALIQKIPYPPTFLKRTPASPLKGSLYWRALGPAIVVSHNGPKNQNTWGIQGGHPWRLFPRSYSISLGQMRKHLRGPGQATYDFDGVRPGLLDAEKGGGRQARPIFAWRVGVCPRRQKWAKTPPGFPRTPDGQPVFLKENRRCRFFLNRCSYNKGAKGPRGPVGRGTEKMRQPIPGAAALFIWAGAGAGVRVDFHREKIDKTTRGSKGGPPWHVFAFFLRVKKEGGPQAKPE